jgi:hypothetical protein
MRRCPGRLLGLFVFASALPLPALAASGAEDLSSEAAAAAQRGDATTILRDVRFRYHRLRSFSASGESVTQLTLMGKDVATPTTFTMRLARPHRYRITWTQTPPGGPPVSGAAWRSSDAPQAYRTAPAGWAVERDDQFALGLGGVASSGAGGIVQLFFNGKSQLSSIDKASLDGTEAVEGEPCWVISGSTIMSSDTLWISRERLVVRRHRSVPQLGREQQAAIEKRAAKNRHKVEAFFSKAGLDSEQRAAMFSTMMDSLRAFADHADQIKMSTTVTYGDVVVDAAIPEVDFEFQVPSGIPRKTSLLDGSPFHAAGAPPPARALRPAPPGEDAKAILARVVARYRDLHAFAAEGRFAHGDGHDDTSLRRTFTLAMQRSGRYRLTWSRDCQTSVEGGAAHTVCPPGWVLWNRYDGATYEKEPNDELALAGGVGASGGAISGLPRFFQTGDRWIVDLIDPVLEGMETVDGNDCYVISGSSRSAVRRTLWISSDRSLIVQHRWSNAAPARDPARGDDLEEAALEQWKRDAPPEEKETVAFVADMQKVMAKHRDVTPGDMTATYRNIRVDDAVPASDVDFVVPAGTPLKAPVQEHSSP